MGGGGEREAIYKSYESAVDWPTAAFFRQLRAAYPSAKFVLTVRTPESWVESFSATIYKLIGERGAAPKEMEAWLDKGAEVIAKTGFPKGLDEAGLTKAFNAHNDAVKAAVPPHQLLTYQVKEGWGPLCAFLGVPEPVDPFPRTNNRGEFWDRVSGKQ